MSAELRHYPERAGMSGEIHVIDRQFGFIRCILPYDSAYTSNSQQWDEANRICQVLEGPMSALGIAVVESSSAEPVERESSRDTT